MQFYDDDRFLAGVVADFIGQGLDGDENIVIVATEAHRAAFCERLHERGFDVAAARKSGQLTLLDAEQTLQMFMVDEAPDWPRFKATLESLIAAIQARRPARRLRAYGEMVDLLWRSGNGDAAIRLEEHWNDLGRLHEFSLLCAYLMGSFYKEAHRPVFDHVCRTHNHVAPTEAYDAKADPSALLRQVSGLQQRARALETEIARRKELEASLRQALEEQRRAEEALRASEQELRGHNETLTRSLKFSETFVGILGHDLRNPLFGITTAASVLARRAESDKVLKPAQRILSSGERMGRMIDQLLDFTRIRLGQGIPLTVGQMDLSVLCQLCLEDAAGPPERAPVLTSVGDVSGCWDGDRLCQLVGNLLGNALTHGPADEPVRISLDGRDAEAVLLEVQNAGVIPTEVLRVIFEPFRGSELKGRKEAGSSGLGLGLYISHKIVLAHRGRMEVTSSTDKGTRFLVRLPRAAEQVTPAFTS